MSGFQEHEDNRQATDEMDEEWKVDVDRFIDLYVKQYPTEADAVDHAIRGFADLWFIVEKHARKPHEVLMHFVFGVDEDLPPIGDVRGNMYEAIESSEEYRRISQIGKTSVKTTHLKSQLVSSDKG